MKTRRVTPKSTFLKFKAWQYITIEIVNDLKNVLSTYIHKGQNQGAYLVLYSDITLIGEDKKERGDAKVKASTANIIVSHRQQGSYFCCQQTVQIYSFHQCIIVRPEEFEFRPQ